LLYHRHFMLSEFANRLASNEANKATLDLLTQSFADRLITTHSADGAKLYLRRHYIPTPEHVRLGLPLDSPEFIAERGLGEFTLPTHRPPISTEVQVAENVTQETYETARGQN
jgi:hypothetical protein